MHAAAHARLGATPDGAQTHFVVWAPLCKRAEIEIVEPTQQRIELHAEEHGYFYGTAAAGAGARYYVLTDNGQRRPDPASRFQPEGVHGVSEVVAVEHEWTDRDWHGISLRDYVIYELHIGTFTDEGTFDAAIERLDYLRELGVTAVEIMPVAQFPGERNWGYDGVLPYAVQNSYGGPRGLKRLVDACHARGLAAILDVVYNHLGPEGNYLCEFAPVFTDRYATPWGPAINVDGEHSDGVRNYFIQNALEWITDYHFDALRLDAVHGILDTSAQPFLAELSDAVHARAQTLDRTVNLIAESDLNDVRMIRPTAEGGMGMDAQWMDDFHHSLHTLLTGEHAGYYVDYGDVRHLAVTLQRGFLFAGEYSQYRKRRHGNLPDGTGAERFVVCIQNHDQVGNRMLGDRIATLVDLERLKLGAACVLFAPYIPLLFMGEEYGERKPFPYFVHHSNDVLVDAVRKGRKEEFAAFAWWAEPSDPQSHQTFACAVVDPLPELDEDQQALHSLYRELLQLRKKHRLGPGANEERDVIALYEHATIVVQRLGSVAVLCFAENEQNIEVPLPRGEWRKAICTASATWRGPGEAIPESVSSPGSVRINLPAVSATLFVSTDSAT